MVPKKSRDGDVCLSATVSVLVIPGVLRSWEADWKVPDDKGTGHVQE